MKVTLILALVLLSALVANCSPQAPASTTPMPVPSATTEHKSGTLRFALNGNPDVQDVPRLMALDALKEQGYVIEQTVFANSDLIPVALTRGDIDFGSGDTSVAWSASTKGGDIRTIIGRAKTSYSLVTKPDLQTCKELGDRPVAFNSSASVGYVMFQKLLKQNCESVTPKLLLMNGSNSRVSALQTGEIDGAWVEMATWLQLKRQAPEKFRALIDFAKEFPEVQYSSFSVRKSWADKNPEIVKDFVRALLTAHRQIISNPGLLRDEIIKYLSVDNASAQASAEAYLTSGIWDADGGLTQVSVQSMIDLLTSGGALPAGVKVEDVSDLSYLDAVLKEIGRK